MAGKKKGQRRAAENAPSHEDFMAAFRAEDLVASLSGDPVTGINVCVECCDRHADGDRVAICGKSPVQMQARPEISPTFVARAPRQCCGGPHGPKGAEGVADTTSKRLAGVRPVTAHGSVSAAESW